MVVNHSNDNDSLYKIVLVALIMPNIGPKMVFSITLDLEVDF